MVKHGETARQIENQRVIQKDKEGGSGGTRGRQKMKKQQDPRVPVFDLYVAGSGWLHKRAQPTWRELKVVFCVDESDAKLPLQGHGRKGA